MSQRLMDEVKENIDKLIETGNLENADVFIFGINSSGDHIIQYMETRGYMVCGIVDNNPKNCKKHMGIPVSNPEILKEKDMEAVRVLICSAYYAEMKEQLEGMGLKEGKNFFKLAERNPGIAFSCEESYFKQAEREVKKGLEIYQLLLEKYGNDREYLLVLPHIGDIYLTCSLMREYQRQHGIQKIALISVGNIAKKIADMFEIEDTISVSQSEIEYLRSLVRFMGPQNIRIRVLHYILYLHIFQNMRYYKEMNMMDYFTRGMLGLNEDYQLTKPMVNKDIDIVKRFGNKDIIIAPYANSLPLLPQKFWYDLTQKLKEQGYRIYTNSNGDIEPAIIGTEPIFLPINEMIAVLDQCAGFVGVRSGLFDIASSTACKKIIIYSDRIQGFGTDKELYSLQDMEWCNNVFEFTYKEDEERLIEKILQTLLEENFEK